MKFLAKPTTDKEAQAYLAALPVVDRETYDAMLPEFQHAAFFISGIRAHDVLRDVLAELNLARAGEDWDAMRQRIEETISPHLGAQARRRSLMIVRAWTGRMAMEGVVRGLDNKRAAFPYRKRLSTGDGRVRASHSAQHGLTLPADHPYWLEHTPPDAHNCRCMVIGVTRAQAARLKAQEDADVEAGTMLPEERRLLEGAALEQLKGGRLSRGPAEEYNLNKEEGRVRWSPGSMLMPVEEIKERYAAAPEVWDSFQQWAQAVRPDGKVTLWEKLTAPRAGAARQVRSPIQTTLPLPAAPVKPRSRAQVLAAILRTPQIRTGPLPKEAKGTKETGEEVAKAVKLTVKAPAGRKAPVSDSFSTVRGNSRAAVEKGLALINAVHDDGSGLMVSRVETPPGTQGTYNLVNGEIEVGRDVGTQLFQFLHETGHKLDFEAIRPLRSRDNEVEAQWAAVMKVIRSSEAAQNLRELRKTDTVDAGYLSYQFRVEELWARAYAQYIAEESGDGDALRELKKRRTEGKYLADSQWTAKDFAPVRKAITVLLEKLGWR